MYKLNVLDKAKKDSQLRRRFTPGFEDLLELGVTITLTNGWYDTNHPLDV